MGGGRVDFLGGVPCAWMMGWNEWMGGWISGHFFTYGV